MVCTACYPWPFLKRRRPRCSDYSKRPIDILTRPLRFVDKSTMPYDEPAPHQSVCDLTFELPSLVNRISGAGADVFTPIQIRAVEVDNRQIGVEADRDASLAMM